MLLTVLQCACNMQYAGAWHTPWHCSGFDLPVNLPCTLAVPMIAGCTLAACMEGQGCMLNVTTNRVNAACRYGQGGIIANPNCSTIIALMAVTPLHKAAKITRMVISTYQASC